MGARGRPAAERQAQNGAAMGRARILVYLEEHPGLSTLLHIGAELGISCRTVWARVQELERDGEVLVTRSRSGRGRIFVELA